jgi:hypothetical protein
MGKPDVTWPEGRLLPRGGSRSGAGGFRGEARGVAALFPLSRLLSRALARGTARASAWASALCLLSLLLAPAAAARAAELKVGGEFQVYQNMNTNWTLQSSRQRDEYADGNTVDQRLRLAFEFAAREDLKAVMELQMGSNSWGQGSLGLGQSDARPGGTFAPMVRQLSIDTVIPGTPLSLKAGYMDFVLASGFAGSPVLEDSSVGAVVFTLPMAGEDLAATFGYLRLWDTFNATAGAAGRTPPRDCHLDGAFLTLPLALGEGVRITPYTLFTWGGRASLSAAMHLSSGNGDAGRVQGLLSPGLEVEEGNGGHVFEGSFTAWWAGLAAKADLGQGFWLAGDLIHGRMSQAWQVNERRGWFADLAAGVKGVEFAGATLDPMVFLAWSSGEDGRTSNGSERMPVLDNYFSVGSFYFTGSAFGNGDMGNQNDQIGFWTAGVSLKHISWFEGLSHDVHVLYIRGTNSHKLLSEPGLPAIRQWDGDFAYAMGSKGGFLTDRDGLWEMDLNTEYKVAEGLRAILELGWIRQYLDRDTWNGYYARGGAPSSASPRFLGVDATKVVCGLIYEF